MERVFDNLKAIFAMGRDGEMGVDLDGKLDLPWGMNLPSDLERFKRITLGHTVIMGVNTWNSLPKRVKPMPGRDNYIIDTVDTKFEGAETLVGMEGVLSLVSNNPNKKFFAIGGPMFLKSAMPHVSQLYLTMINSSFPDATAHLDEFTRSDIGRHFIPNSHEPEPKYENGYFHIFFDAKRRL